MSDYQNQGPLVSDDGLTRIANRYAQVASTDLSAIRQAATFIDDPVY